MKILKPKKFDCLDTSEIAPSGFFDGEEELPILRIRLVTNRFFFFNKLKLSAVLQCQPLLMLHNPRLPCKISTKILIFKLAISSLSSSHFFGIKRPLWEIKQFFIGSEFLLALSYTKFQLAILTEKKGG